MIINPFEMAVLAMCENPRIHITGKQLVGISDFGILYGSTKATKHYSVEWVSVRGQVLPQSYEIKSSYIVNEDDYRIARLRRISNYDGNSLEDAPDGNVLRDSIEHIPATTIINAMSHLAYLNQGIQLSVYEYTIHIGDFLKIRHNALLMRNHVKPIAPQGMNMTSINKILHNPLGYAIAQECLHQIGDYEAIETDKSVWKHNTPRREHLTNRWEGNSVVWYMLGCFMNREDNVRELFISKDGKIGARSDNRSFYTT